MCRMCKRVAFQTKPTQRTIHSGGHRAVMFDRFSGVKNTVRNAFVLLPTLLTSDTQASSEGTHFLVPWLQKAVLFDVRTKPKVRGTVRHRTCTDRRDCVAHRDYHRY